MIPALLSRSLTERTVASEFYVERIIVNQVIRIEPNRHRGMQIIGRFLLDNVGYPGNDRIIPSIVLKHCEE